MAVLGLLLLAAAVAAGVELSISNRERLEGEAFGYVVADASPMAFLLTGAGLALVAVLGLMLMTGGFARRRRRHRARRSQMKETAQQNRELLEENERLRNEMVQEDRQRATMGGVAVPPGTGDVSHGDQVGDAVRSTTISDTGRYDPYPAESRPGARVDTESDAGEPHRHNTR